jgi:hypothetical protein
VKGVDGAIPMIAELIGYFALAFLIPDGAGDSAGDRGRGWPVRPLRLLGRFGNAGNALRFRQPDQPAFWPAEHSRKMSAEPEGAESVSPTDRAARPRLLVLLGAGSTIHAGAPSTQEIIPIGSARFKIITGRFILFMTC